MKEVVVAIQAGSLLDGDASGDGKVGSADLDIVRANWGSGISVVLFEILVSETEITVPEGLTAQFEVRLSAEPSGTITVTTARTDGDEDLDVNAGAVLTFDATNWSIPQPVTLAAAADADTIDGIAEFTVSADGATNQPIVTATEDDDGLFASQFGASRVHSVATPLASPRFVIEGIPSELELRVEWHITEYFFFEDFTHLSETDVHPINGPDPTYVHTEFPGGTITAHLYDSQSALLESHVWHVNANLLSEIQGVHNRTVQPGESCGIQFEVVNYGSAPANSGTVHFYWHEGTPSYDPVDKVGESAYGSLRPGGNDFLSYYWEVPLDTQPGEYCLSWFVDATNTTSESGEGNKDSMTFGVVEPPSGDAKAGNSDPDLVREEGGVGTPVAAAAGDDYQDSAATSTPPFIGPRRASTSDAALASWRNSNTGRSLSHSDLASLAEAAWLREIEGLRNKGKGVEREALSEMVLMSE